MCQQRSVFCFDVSRRHSRLLHFWEARRRSKCITLVLLIKTLYWPSICLLLYLHTAMEQSQKADCHFWDQSSQGHWSPLFRHGSRMSHLIASGATQTSNQIKKCTTSDRLDWVFDPLTTWRAQPGQPNVNSRRNSMIKSSYHCLTILVQLCEPSIV